MKKWNSDIAFLSDYNEDEARKLARLDIFTFLFNLNDKKERADKVNKTSSHTDSFGRE